MISLNTTEFNLSPFNNMTSDLTEANLCAIATPTSTIALSVAPLVSSAFPESDDIPDDGTYYSGIDFL